MAWTSLWISRTLQRMGALLALICISLVDTAGGG
jgi:hypothetical protein